MIPPPPEKPVKRKVFCVKFQKELPGLDETPFDNELGQRIYDNVSRDAWNLWKEHLKMIMNEYRLNLATPEAQEIVMKQMEDYFFGEGAALPPDYVPPKAKG
jgi:Fe-S cluster biosynthesis and repair protein YggX